MNSAYKIVAEFEKTVAGMGEPVRAKILESMSESRTLRFEIRYSHYYKPSAAAAGVWRTSATACNSVNEAEQLIRAYLSGFTAEFGVERVEHY